MKRWLPRMILLSVAAALAASSPALGQVAGDKVYRLGQLAVSEASIELTTRETVPALEKLGFVSGRNLLLDLRFGTPEQLPALAQELVAARPDAIIAIGADALRAASAATQVVPIVFYGPDPVMLGLANSLSRPGGNVTGVVILATELDGKRLALLHETMPTTRRVAVLHRTNSPNRQLSDRETHAVAATTEIELLAFEAAGIEGYAGTFLAMREAGAEALLVAADPTLYRDTAALVKLAHEAGLPAFCQWTAMAHAGCLLAYGPNQAALRQRLARYVARIFRGAAAGDLPIEQPTTFELVINLKTAKMHGIAVPTSLLVLADEVIE